jgi:adenine/guanine phosphoribosyltransferase-like PRPP-binding protein
MKELINAFDNKELIKLDNGFKFIINPLSEQIPCTTSNLLKEACQEIIKRIPKETTKLVTEEDRGAILVAGTSMITGLPFGMFRWNPNGLPGQVKVSFSMEYTSGNLYLNGINKNDKVTIIEDMISSGGTLIAMIKAIENIGAEILCIISVAEKINYEGVKRIKDEGYDVISLVKIDVSDEISKVLR